jgi:hypothetical protein
LFDEHDFHPDRNIGDWTDDQEVVDRELSGLPDLVLSIAVVQEQIDKRQKIEFLRPVLKETSIACYDFPLQQTMKQAFQIGGSLRSLVDPAAYGSALPWERAVTFSVTHDVPNNDGSGGMLLDPQDEYSPTPTCSDGTEACLWSTATTARAPAVTLKTRGAGGSAGTRTRSSR